MLFDGHLSPVTPVLYGVPQGSVLRPLLFVTYTANLSRVVTQYGLSVHQYADDCQVYLSSTVNDAPLSVDRFARCVEDFLGYLAERQPVTLESYKDSSLMARLEIFSGQDHCPSRAGPVFTSPGRRLGPRPRRRHR